MCNANDYQLENKILQKNAAPASWRGRFTFLPFRNAKQAEGAILSPAGQWRVLPGPLGEEVLFRTTGYFGAREWASDVGILWLVFLVINGVASSLANLLWLPAAFVGAGTGGVPRAQSCWSHAIM